MDELSNEALGRLGELDSSVPHSLEKLGNNAELWMTYLSKPSLGLKITIMIVIARLLAGFVNR